MMNKKSSWVVLALLLMSILIVNVKAEALTVDKVIYIKEDGSIVYVDSSGNEELLPPEGPIKTTDNITYILTADIKCSGVDYTMRRKIGIVVKRDNIVVDGQNHILEGVKTLQSTGVYLSGIKNVTIKDMTVKTFFYGMYLELSSNNKILGNTITDNADSGVYLFSCVNNTISRNTITNNGMGIILNSVCSYNNITENSIKNNRFGINLFNADVVNNNIIDNIIENNENGVCIKGCSNNTFHHNDFINNTKQVFISSASNRNFWDNGTCGNYWSDYTGFDNNGDGIGDVPYEIDAFNKDRYPIWTIGGPPSIPMELVVVIVVVVVVAVVGAAVYIKRRKEKA